MAKPLILENYRLIFKNFSGKSSKFNKEGNRNFSILIDDERVATDLIREGWNIKELRQLEPEDPINWHLPVTVSYAVAPPRIYAIKSKGRLTLTEGTVAMLDYTPLLGSDIKINPYYWSVNGESGVKAYLGSLYAVIDEDELDIKYSEIPDIGEER